METFQVCLALLCLGVLTEVAESCGGNLVATETTQFLTSPNYPNNYVDNLNCHWTIQAPSDHTIIAEVTDMDIEQDSGCPYDSLWFYENGITSNKYCGAGSVPAFDTTTSRLDVYFVTDTSIQARGFQLSYRAVSAGGRIRLAGGSTPNKGRVELLSGGYWGTICDDLWDINDAHVVCRMLGYHRALSSHGSAFFGPGSGDIVLDDVQCSGTEETIFQCPAVTNSDCTHSEDAGVICDPYIRPCADLPDPANGYVTYDQAYALYHCDRGYEISGTPNRTCAENGAWVGPEPSCKRVSCQLPDDLPNGYYTYVGLQYMDTMTYSCDPGFTYGHPDNNKNTFVCGPDGTWDYTTLPTCTATCGNNDLLTDDSGVLYSPGFPGNYQNRQRCTWVLRPRDNHLALFQLHFLQTEHFYDKLTVYEGSSESGDVIVSLSGRYPPDDVFSSKTTDDIYVVLETDATNTDRGFNLTYWASDCPFPPSISNGVSSFSGQLAGATLQYSCDPGHVLIGAPNTTCVEGVGWSAPEPTCQIVTCPALPSPSQLVVSNHVCMTYGCSASFSCSTGFELTPDSPGQTVCQADGTWSGQEPACQVIHCPALQRPEYGKILGNETAWGSVIEFECKYGFSQGSTFRTCQGAGTWSGNDVICKAPIQCEFEADFCSYEQGRSDDFDWTRTNRETTSPGTGPSSGYGGLGYYAYIESSPPHRAGDVARLISQEFEPEGCAQLQFHYHMLGDAIDTLNVYIETRTNKLVRELVWFRKGDQGSAWQEARVSFPPEGYHKVIFEAFVGSSHTSDIAIDAVRLIQQPCADPTTEQPTTAEPTPTIPPTEEITTLPYTPSVTVQTDAGITNVTTTAPATVNVEPSTTPVTMVDSTMVTTGQPSASTSIQEITSVPPTTLAATLVPVTDCRIDQHIPGDGIDIISSPNYPEQYPPNLDCWYVITTDPGYSLQVNILNFDLPGSPTDNNVTSGGCTDDYLEVHAPLGGPPSQRYCGQALSPGTTFSSNATFALHFVTDGVNASGGFSAIIRSVPSSLA
ncbi:CUB and sushi domain-containing protein 3-like isoform X1 [Branchiostoma floridae]|uniref:Soluble scavenger receptor cysteine-rich domain-containing protein SSC5D n=2 Tax=Branchiostoma floridae TaxID=7739 RepID=A0A9J7LK28_BRAFL|nr:CUB and sushi domain-containing protein 3-like isoform X1 [Branchiostoma floridae]